MQINLQFNTYQELRDFFNEVFGRKAAELIAPAVDLDKLVKEPKKEPKNTQDQEKKQRKPRVTVTEELRAEILKDYDSGYSVKEVAAMNNVSANTVFRIINSTK